MTSLWMVMVVPVVMLILVRMDHWGILVWRRVRLELCTMSCRGRWEIWVDTVGFIGAEDFGESCAVDGIGFCHWQWWLHDRWTVSSWLWWLLTMTTGKKAPSDANRASKICRWDVVIGRRRLVGYASLAPRTGFAELVEASIEKSVCDYSLLVMWS